MLNNLVNGNLKVVSGSSHPDLAKKIVDKLSIKQAKLKLSRFSCGETYARMEENIRGANMYVIQTCGPTVNTDLMELFIIIDSMKRASAKSITAVIPHFGYARQDKKSASREPISAKLIADLLTAAGANRLITMDLHAEAIQGFFNYPVDHMTALLIFVDYLKSLKLKDPVVVAPDTGRAKVAKKLADRLGVHLAIMYKTRPEHNVAEISHLVGDVEGKTAILFDDMVDTAGTITQGLNTLRMNGVTDIYLVSTHAVFSGPAVERLSNAGFKEIIVTDSVPIPEEKNIPGLKVLSCAPLLAEAINRNHHNQSISELFD
ncbi:MAG: ribose-phosphate pyrophosphokinase [Candidatus Margulisiibacteriota bacterium]